MNNCCKASRWLLVFLVAVQAALFAVGASAQSIQLTPQQEQMINQLPAAQREQALRQIELLQRQGGDGSELSSLSELPPELLTPAGPVPEEVPEELRAERSSRLVVTLDLKEDLDNRQKREFERDEALRRIEGSRYYELDDAGVLNLPGLPSIPLLGLTAEQIVQRLGAEPALSVFEIVATILESETTGVCRAGAVRLRPVRG